MFHFSNNFLLLRYSKKATINAYSKQHKQRDFHYGRTIDTVHNRLYSFDYNNNPLRGSNVICGLSE